MNTEEKKIEDKKPMTIHDLKERIDMVLSIRDRRELTVCIPNNKGGMGGTTVTNVIGANVGIDWDAGKFFIYPEVKMIERPPDFTESEFQAALQRISSLEAIANRLVAAIESNNEKELKMSVRHAKNILDIFQKKPVKPS